MCPGRENMLSSIRSPFPLHILPMGFLLWLCKSKEDVGSELPNGNHGKSLVRERWNPIWTFGNQFFRTTVTICLKYILSRPRETCRCPHDFLRISSVTDFHTLKYSREMRETPFGETDFWAVGLWLAAQVTHSAWGRFSVFSLEKSPFHEISRLPL